jgi:membrane protein
VTRLNAFALLRQTLVLWDLHSIPRLAAALAFYAVLSLAPFLVLVVGASAMLFGERITQQDAIRDLREIVGPEATLLIGSVISGARHAPSNPVSGIATVLVLLWGASSAFVELRSALNYIWGLPESASGIKEFLTDRLFAFGMTTAMGFLLLACLSTSVGLAVFQPYFARRLVLPEFLVATGNFLASFAVTGLTFSLIFRYVPAKGIAWREAWTAGLVTATAFTLARIPLDLYLTHAAVGSGYGAAASLVIFLMWIYVAAQIFYMGGEFARLVSDSAL